MTHAFIASINSIYPSRIHPSKMSLQTESAVQTLTTALGQPAIEVWEANREDFFKKWSQCLQKWVSAANSLWNDGGPEDRAAAWQDMVEMLTFVAKVPDEHLLKLMRACADDKEKFGALCKDYDRYADLGKITTFVALTAKNRHTTGTEAADSSVMPTWDYESLVSESMQTNQTD